MPDTDMANVQVIGTESGFVKTTKAWVLGRLLRDARHYITERLDSEPDATTPNQRVAFRVYIYELQEEADHGVPNRDWVWYSRFLIILVQLAISIVPWILSSQWGAFLVTLSGNVLALVEGSLSPWKKEKWATPKRGSATVTLTQGNGSRLAMVFLGNKNVGLDLEILAQGNYIPQVSLVIKVITVVLSVLWIALLVTISGLKLGTWYLFGIGLLGSIQTIVVGAARRSPYALGFHIKLVETIAGSSFSTVLKKLEEAYPLVGSSLVPVLFPGSMPVKDDNDVAFWRSAQEKRLGSNKWGVRIDNLPKLETIESEGDEITIQ
ncbi:hypothetical protein BDZ45DRAFT_636646 [Acephala macrosclerotiorum]|nr:hypothetical protein BDZ45DRAFT_636646 [Acephala macrosclerotiorum]